MAFDSVGPAGGGGTGASGTAPSFTHTTVAPSTTVLVFACLDGVAPGVTASATLGGVTMTQLGSDVACGTGGTTGILRVWSMAAVASGAHTIVITCATANDIACGSIAYVTTGLGTPVTNAGSANGTTSFISLPASTSGNTVCAFIGAGNAITATTGPAVNRVGFGTVGAGSNWLGGSGAAGGNGACSDVAAGGSVTVTWSCASSVAGTFAVEIQAAAGGQRERVPQQLSRITKHRRGAAQQQQYAFQLPSVNIVPPLVTASASVPVPSVSVGKPYITGLAGTPGPGWFTDQAGNPRLWVATETWGIIVNAGAWTSGDWQTEMRNFVNTRASQGFTVVMTDPKWSESSNTESSGGNMWDGTTPLAGGSTDPSTAALNNTFWTRVDYLLSAAAGAGITVGLVLWNNNDNGLGQSAWTSAQWQAWGNKIGTRYAGTPNIIWMFGNDAFPTGPDSTFDAIRTGLTAAGASQLGPVAWWEAEFTSRYDTSANVAAAWGVAHSITDFCYTYNAGYWVIEYAYGEVANQGAANLLPVILGDGYFYQGNATYSSTYDRALRQETWWCLASAARGILFESEAVYPWSSSSSPGLVATEWFPANNMAHIVTSFTGLPGWNKLMPDLGNALVTAGRGTRVTGFTSGGGHGQYEPAFTNSYVAASKTPDGTLAVCYLPNAVTITVNTALLAAGWTASWIDPVTGASSSAGAGPTFNSTAKGTNSQADPDWVLVFQAPPLSLAPALRAGARGTWQAAPQTATFT